MQLHCRKAGLPGMWFDPGGSSRRYKGVKVSSAQRVSSRRSLAEWLLKRRCSMPARAVLADSPLSLNPLHEVPRGQQRDDSMNDVCCRFFLVALDEQGEIRGEGTSALVHLLRSLPG